jgi:hypothetical protein
MKQLHDCLCVLALQAFGLDGNKTVFVKMICIGLTDQNI